LQNIPNKGLIFKILKNKDLSNSLQQCFGTLFYLTSILLFGTKLKTHLFLRSNC
jgi:hypothetical protein